MSVESLTKNDKKMSTKAKSAIDIADAMMKIAREEMDGMSNVPKDMSAEWKFREKLLKMGELYDRLEEIGYCIEMLYDLDDEHPGMISKKDMAELNKWRKGLDDMLRRQRDKQMEMMSMPVITEDQK